MSTSAIEDRLALEDLLSRYAWASDEQQFAAVRDCFTPDGLMVVHYPDGSEESVAGADAIAQWVERGRHRLGRSVLKRHLTSCFLLQSCDERAAFATAYFCVLHAHPGQPLHASAMGRYEDSFRRTPQGWRFARRVIRVEAHGVPAAASVAAAAPR